MSCVPHTLLPPNLPSSIFSYTVHGKIQVCLSAHRSLVPKWLFKIFSKQRILTMWPLSKIKIGQYLYWISKTSFKRSAFEFFRSLNQTRHYKTWDGDLGTERGKLQSPKIFLERITHSLTEGFMKVLVNEFTLFVCLKCCKRSTLLPEDQGGGARNKLY